MMGLDPPPNHMHAETAKAGGWNLRPAAIPEGVVITADDGRHESIERFQDRYSAPFLQGAFLAGLVRSQQESGMDERVRRYIDESKEVVAAKAKDQLAQTFALCLPDCASEIERLLMAAFLRLEVLNNYGAEPKDFEVLGSMDYYTHPRSFEGVRGASWKELEVWQKRGWFTAMTFVYPQVCFDPYRVDFLLGHVDIDVGKGDLRSESWIVVECDGHEFHDKTKEQAQRDKARDRFLVASGAKVMRFTGSEIWRDPTACAVEALEAVCPSRLCGWLGGWVIEP
jgi:very-short-patch-repair endonuclease